MSKIGNNAFTFIEVMVTIVVLSLGTVFIFGSFFISLDTYRYCAHFFNVMPWADNKMWEIQDSLSTLGPKAHFQASGSFTQENTDYTWGVNYAPVDPKLYKIDLVLSWREGKRHVSLKRNAYATYEQ
jgi:prepilin-type N-terminal cleavage/methylation domain-containing protein